MVMHDHKNKLAPRLLFQMTVKVFFVHLVHEACQSSYIFGNDGELLTFTFITTSIVETG